MIILNGFSCCLKTSILEYFNDKYLCIPSDSILFKEFRDLGLTDYNQTQRLLAKLIILRQFEGTKTIIDRSLVDQLAFIEMMHRGVCDYVVPDCDKVFDLIDKYKVLENSIESQHILIINENRWMIDQIIQRPDFSESMRFDMFHNTNEFMWGQDDFVKFYKTFIDKYDEIIIPNDLEDWDDIVDDLFYKLNKVIV